MTLKHSLNAFGLASDRESARRGRRNRQCRCAFKGGRGMIHTYIYMYICIHIYIDRYLLLHIHVCIRVCNVDIYVCISNT